MNNSTLNKFIKALQDLTEAVEITQKRELSKLEKKGLIKAFEFTKEMARNALQKYFKEQKIVNLEGETWEDKALELGLIQSAEIWVKINESRNITAHEYDEAQAQKIYEQILQEFHPAFKEFATNLAKHYQKND